MVIFQLINEKEMRELEYHHFVSPKELMDIDLKGQATKVKKKKRDNQILCFTCILTEKQNTIYTERKRKSDQVSGLNYQFRKHRGQRSMLKYTRKIQSAKSRLWDML